MKKILEIRAAEGGEDSKLFCEDLAMAYVKLASHFDWKALVTSSSPGYVEIMFDGKDLNQLKHECGGHRIQRIPPTERKGRVHTSTVTVAIIDGTQTKEESISEKDINIEWYSGSGAGGQHRNKHQNSCRLTHIPTGIITTSQTRSRQNSYKLAFDELRKRITDIKQTELSGNIASDRKRQVGSGMRGDKIRTYRFQDDSVVDHQTNKRAKTSQVLKGRFDLLWR